MMSTESRRLYDDACWLNFTRSPPAIRRARKSASEFWIWVMYDEKSFAPSWDFVVLTSV